MKLEKAKVELGEALKRVSEVSNENDENVKKFDILTDQHKNVQNDLRSIRAEMTSSRRSRNKQIKNSRSRIKNSTDSQVKLTILKL